jgi:3-hydroxyisobutyrate dehydrogenase-like beta-hydroxyacid dehydrogenase
MHESAYDLSASVGLVGLGLLGSALAERLLHAGFSVAGFDRDAARREELSRLGGVTADSAVELLHCSRILLSLPDADVSQRVVTEIEDGLRPGTIVVDTTTGDPETMATLGERLAARQVAYLDATVGGSSEMCRRGEAIVIAGGDPDAFSACSDLFATFAKQSFHLGPSGSGARMKLVLNLVLGLNRAALAEGLALAGRFGIDPWQALEILQAGPAYSTVMDAKGDKMIAGEFTPQARLSQHLKDVRLILSHGAAANAVLPLSQLHEALLQGLVELGLGDCDNSAIIEAFADRRH